MCISDGLKIKLGGRETILVSRNDKTGQSID